jgi:hypothetical protein
LSAWTCTCSFVRQINEIKAIKYKDALLKKKGPSNAKPKCHLSVRLQERERRRQNQRNGRLDYQRNRYWNETYLPRIIQYSIQKAQLLRCVYHEWWQYVFMRCHLQTSHSRVLYRVSKFITGNSPCPFGTALVLATLDCIAPRSCCVTAAAPGGSCDQSGAFVAPDRVVRALRSPR